MKLYKIAPEAEIDLQKIVDYIAADNRLAARKILESLQKKFQFLGEHPRLVASQKRYRNLSKHKVGNYLIFFRPDDRGVEIIRVLHAARDIESIMSPH